tara:strand:- start:639 stop:806 length:168 start_codon:yes stop_codon:yes gene_type:complete
MAEEEIPYWPVYLVAGLILVATIVFIVAFIILAVSGTFASAPIDTEAERNGETRK